MSAACVLSEDQFLCSICLDVFTDPVTTPCGHNFCKNCITEYWRINVRCQCPNCKEIFKRRPKVKVNTFISEMAAQFRQAAQQEANSSSTEQQASEEEKRRGEVSCDDCTGAKLKAELQKTEVQQMIQKRQQVIQEIKHSVKISGKNTDKGMAEGVQVFTALKKSVERSQAELKRVQQYEVDVTLDPDTAHPNLVLSDDGKQVHKSDVKKKLPDTPERFNPAVCVLSKQSFSSGRFYYEVQVQGKIDWTLGVAKESINRKGRIIPSPQNGFWTIWLRNENEYIARANPSVCLSVKSGLKKVGVFVDYEEGLVSFYDPDAAVLIYSFTGCSFNQKIYPYFSPSGSFGGRNSAPLIISAVNCLM